MSKKVELEMWRQQKSAELERRWLVSATHRSPKYTCLLLSRVLVQATCEALALNAAKDRLGQLQTVFDVHEVVAGECLRETHSIASTGERVTL